MSSAKNEDADMVDEDEVLKKLHQNIVDHKNKSALEELIEERLGDFFCMQGDTGTRSSAHIEDASSELEDVHKLLAEPDDDEQLDLVELAGKRVSDMDVEPPPRKRYYDSMDTEDDGKRDNIKPPHTFVEAMIINEPVTVNIPLPPKPRCPWINSGSAASSHLQSVEDYTPDDPAMTPALLAEHKMAQANLKNMQMGENGVLDYAGGLYIHMMNMSGNKRRRPEGSDGYQNRRNEFNYGQPHRKRAYYGKGDGHYDGAESSSLYQDPGSSSQSEWNESLYNRMDQAYDGSASQRDTYMDQSMKDSDDLKQHLWSWDRINQPTNTFLEHKGRPEQPYDYTGRGHALRMFHKSYDYVVEGDPSCYRNGAPTDGMRADRRLKVIIHGKDGPGNRVAVKAYGFHPYVRFRVPRNWYAEPGITSDKITHRLNVLMQRLEFNLKSMVNQRCSSFKIRNVLKLPLIVAHEPGQGWESGQLISSWFLHEKNVRNFIGWQPEDVRYRCVEVRLVHPMLCAYVVDLLQMKPGKECDEWLHYDTDKMSGLGLCAEPPSSDAMRYELPHEHFHVYEGKVPLHTRMMMDLKLCPSNWIEVERNAFSVVPHNKQSTLADLEVECHFHALSSVADDMTVGCLPDVMTPATNASAHKRDLPLKDFIPSNQELEVDIEVLVASSGRFPYCGSEPINKISCIISDALLGEKIEIQLGVGHVVKPPIDDQADEALRKAQSAQEYFKQVTYTYESEREMLMAWLILQQTVMPEDLGGWNMNRFDLPYIHNRCMLLGLGVDVNFLGCVHSKRVVYKKVRKISKEITTVNFSGIVVVDMMLILADMFKMRSQSLAYACSKLLSTKQQAFNKLDMSHEMIRYFQCTPEGRWYLGEYCGQDVRVLYWIWNKVKLGVVMLSMSRWNKTSLQEALDHGMLLNSYNSTLWACIINGPKVHGHNTLVLISQRGDAVVVEYTGAEVLDPNRGYYDVPVATLDFASMYPSIMIAGNVCPSTYLSPQDIDKHGFIGEGVQYFRVPKPIHDEKTRRVKMVPDPTAHAFIVRSLCQGLIPLEEQNLMDERKQIKLSMKPVDARVKQYEARIKELEGQKDKLDADKYQLAPKTSDSTETKLLLQLQNELDQQMLEAKQQNIDDLRQRCEARIQDLKRRYQEAWMRWRASQMSTLCVEETPESQFAKLWDIFTIGVDLSFELAKLEALLAGDVFLYNWLDACQNMCKLKMNGWYGALGQPYSDIVHMPCASTITAVGRYLICFTSDYIDRKYNNATATITRHVKDKEGNILETYTEPIRIVVIYGDTDSVMLAMDFHRVRCSEAYKNASLVERRTMMVQKAQEFSPALTEEINNEYPKLMPLQSRAMNVAFEKVYFPMQLMDCKMYAAYKFEPGLGKDRAEEIDMKGLCTKRRDSPMFVVKWIEEFMEYAFKNMDRPGAERVLRENFRKLINDEVNYGLFMMSKSMSKESVSEYKVENAQTVLNEKTRLRDGTEYRKGERMSYVMVKPTDIKDSVKNRDIKQKDKVEDALYALNNNIPINIDEYKRAAWKKVAPLLLGIQKPIMCLEVPPGVQCFTHDTKDHIICKPSFPTDEEQQQKDEEVIVKKPASRRNMGLGATIKREEYLRRKYQPKPATTNDPGSTSSAPSTPQPAPKNFFQKVLADKAAASTKPLSSYFQRQVNKNTDKPKTDVNEYFSKGTGQAVAMAPCYVPLDRESLKRQKANGKKEMALMERKYFADPSMHVTTPSYVALVQELENIRLTQKMSASGGGGGESSYTKTHQDRLKQMANGKLVMHISDAGGVGRNLGQKGSGRCFKCSALVTRHDDLVSDGYTIFCQRCLDTGRDASYFEDMRRDTETHCDNLKTYWGKCDPCARRTLIPDQTILDRIAFNCKAECFNLYDRIKAQKEVIKIVDTYNRMQGVAVGSEAAQQALTSVHKILEQTGYEDVLEW